MTLPLSLASLLLGLALLVPGVLLLRQHPGFEKLLRNFPRSQTATWILFGGGAAWFLFRVLQLGEADFGDYKLLLFLLFGASAILAFTYVPDFLAVRGLAVLVLLSAGPLLDAAFLQEPASRLFLVSAVYLLIALSIYLGVVPYRFRDFVNWLGAGNRRAAWVGSVLSAYGALLCLLSVLYLF